jgi:hypothetical protein
MSDVAEHDLGDIVDEAGNPESDLRAEHELVGGLLWKPEATSMVRDLVSPELFFDRTLGRVFSQMVELNGFEPPIEDLCEWIGAADLAGRTGKQAVGYLRSIGAGLSAEEMADRADRIFEVGERRMTAQGQVSTAEPFQSKMGLLTWADRNTGAPDLYDWLIEDLVPERELTLMMGASQAGKSFLGFHMAMCLARCVPFFGRRILNPVPVVWGAFEGGRGARARMLAYANHHGLDGSEFPFAALTRPIDLWSRETNVVELVKEIKGVISTEFAGVPPGAFFVDTHNAATPGASEIDSEAVSKIRDRYRHVARDIGCGIVIIGHTNAVGKHRGSELLYNNVDTVITVAKKTVMKERTPVQIKDNDRRDVRTVDLVKQREGETGHLFDFVLPAVETGIKNKFGKVRTSCVVVAPNWSEQDQAEADASGKKSDTKAGFKLTDIEDHFFKVLWKELEDSGVPAPGGMGIPSGTRVVHRADVSKAYKESSIPEDGGLAVSPNTIKTRWTRATGRLRKFSVIGFKEPFFWWTGKPIFGKPETRPQRSLFDGAPNHEFPPDDDFPSDT